MQPWRKVGGINRSAKNQNIRAPRTVVTGDYYITKDNKISGVQFADTTRQITAAETADSGYWYDLSNDNLNIYRVDGSVNVGKKEPTKLKEYSEKQIFDLSSSSETFGSQQYDNASPYQISNDGNMLVVGDADAAFEEIYTYLWNKDDFKWEKSVTDETGNKSLIPTIKNPYKDSSVQNMFFGSNISLYKSNEENGVNSILAVSYPSQYLFIYRFSIVSNVGLKWVLLKSSESTESNPIYNFLRVVDAPSEGLPNWGASISIVGNGNQYFLTVGCPNFCGLNQDNLEKSGYIIYDLNISNSDYSLLNKYSFPRDGKIQLGYSISSFYKESNTNGRKIEFRTAIGAPYYNFVDNENKEHFRCGAIFIHTIKKEVINGLPYITSESQPAFVQSSPQERSNFGWSVSIDQNEGKYLSVGSPAVLSENVVTLNNTNINQNVTPSKDTNPQLGIKYSVDNYKDPLAITVSSADNYDPNNPNDKGPSYQIFDTDNLSSGQTQFIKFTALKKQTVTGYLIGNGIPGQEGTKYDGNPRGGVGGNGVGPYKGSFDIEEGQTFTVSFTYDGNVEWKDQKGTSLKNFSIKNSSINPSNEYPDNKYNEYGGLGGEGGVYKDGNNSWGSSGQNATITTAQDDLFKNVIKVNPKDSNGNFFWDYLPTAFGGAGGGGQGQAGYDQYGGAAYYGTGGPYSNAGENQNSDRKQNAGGSEAVRKKNYGAGGGGAVYGGPGGRGGPGAFILINEPLDTTAPVISIPGNNPLTVAQGSSFTPPIATSDDGSTVTVKSNNVDTSKTGDYSVVYTATDGSGNTGTATLTVKVTDQTAPKITITGNNPLTVAQGSSFTPPTATSDDGSTVNVKSNNVDTSKTGDYSVVYTATDGSGNTGTATLTVKVTDQTAPSAPQFVSFPSGKTENKVTIKLIDDATTWSYSVDNGSSFTAGSGTTFNLISGTYNAGKIQIKSKDNSGNESEVSKNTSTVVVNTNTPEPPSVKFPDTNSSTGVVTVTLGKNASYWAYSVDSGTTFNQGSGNQFTLGTATYAANQIIVKNMTNTGTESSTVKNTSSITVNTGPVGNPIVTWPVDDPLKYPTNKTEVKVIMGTGAKSWSYSTDGSNFTSPISSNGSFFLNEGTYDIGKVIIKNKNDVGTSSSTSNSYKITIDTTPPTVTLNGSNPQFVEKGQKWVDPSVTATDQSGIKSIQLTGSVDSNNVGTYPVTYKVTDNAENVTSLKRNVIVQDTTAPTLVVTSPSTTQDGITKIGQSNILTEPGAKVEVSSDAGNNFTSINIDNNGKGFHNYGPGVYEPGVLQSKSTDKAGNVTTKKNSSRIITVTDPATGVISVAKGFYIQDNGSKFNEELIADDPIQIGDYNRIGLFFLEQLQPNSSSVKIYIQPGPPLPPAPTPTPVPSIPPIITTTRTTPPPQVKLYLDVITSQGNDYEELTQNNLTQDPNKATIFSILNYKEFISAVNNNNPGKNWKGFPDTFTIDKDQYWITTNENGKFAILAINFDSSDVSSRTRLRAVSTTSFNILDQFKYYTSIARSFEAQSFSMVDANFDSDYGEGPNCGKISVLKFNPLTNIYEEMSMQTNINANNKGKMGYAIKIADNRVFAGFQTNNQIDYYKLSSENLDYQYSIHNDNNNFSKIIVSDSKGLVLGSNFISTIKNPYEINRVILYNNRKPYNFFVDGYSGVFGNFVVNKSAEVLSLRQSNDTNDDQIIDNEYGGNLLPFSVGAIGELTNNKLLIGVGLPDEGQTKEGFKINSIIKKNDSAIVYTDSWGKFSKNQTSGLSICPGNYFNEAAGVRLDASGNVVINGNLTVTGDLVVEGETTNNITERSIDINNSYTLNNTIKKLEKENEDMRDHIVKLNRKMQHIYNYLNLK